LLALWRKKKKERMRIMKRKHTAIAAPLAVFAATIAIVSWAFAEGKLTLDQLPTAVRATIEQHAGQGKIVEVERETEHGQIVYEAEVRVDGKKVEIVVAENGKLLPTDAEDEEDEEGERDDDSEAPISWQQLPAAVQDALAKIVPSQKIDALTREVEDGFVFFEAEYETDGVEHAAKLTDNGYVIESEQPVSAESLPPAVVAALKEQFKNAEIVESEIVQLTFFEVKVRVGNKKREVKVQANGNVIADEDDD